MLQDKDSNIVFTHYDQTNHEWIAFEKYSNNGDSMQSKKIIDASGCYCFYSYCISETKGGGYIAGAEYDLKTMIIRLDHNFDTLWTRRLSWGQNNYPVSIVHDRDNGFMVLLNYEGMIGLYHIDENGDSISLHQFNPMVSSWPGKMKRTIDGGYLISGGTYDVNNVQHGYLVKADSLGRFNPQCVITALNGTTICNGDSVVLSGPSGNYQYEWSTGDTLQTIAVRQTGSYYLTITGVTGHSATSAAINVSASVPVIPQITNHIGYLQSSPAMQYQWYHNGILIPGATHDTLHTTLTGNFTVFVTDINGCLAVSPMYYYSWTNIFSSADADTYIYPVPANEILYINNPGSHLKITILDQQGRIIKEEEKLSAGMAEIDVKDLPSGLYFVQLKAEEGFMVKKFVVLH
jgi:hypothetical protein